MTKDQGVGCGEGLKGETGTDERMRRIMCIDSPENGKTFAIVWEGRGVSCWPAKFGRGRWRVEGVEGFVVTFVWPGTTSLPLG